MKRREIDVEARIVVLGAPLNPEEIDHVGWGGVTRTITATVPLGLGVARTPDYGIRRAVWDAAFGYVSGFRKRDIAYYLLTRSLSARVAEAVIRWEAKRERSAEEATR
ncbi:MULTISPECIES: hypothetical protein [unclassified Microbacterium]|uniref:hypothetical protein n=1 Tax=unclassified Microbacterium TaxID=2609290 RepID=UPI003015C52B